MNNIILLIIVLIICSGCGGDHGSQALTSLPDGTVVPAMSPDSSGTANSGGSISGGSANNGIVGAVSGSSNTYPSTSGSFKLKTTTNITLNANQTVYGLTSDAGNLYMLLEENEGGGIRRWLFQKMPNGQTNFTTVCSILDDGHFSGGLAWDGIYFYTLNIAASAYFRRIQASNCIKAAALNSAFSANDEYGALPARVINYDGTQLYWRNQSPLYTSNSSNGVMTGSFDGSVNLGNSSMTIGGMGAFTVKNKTIWATYQSGGYIQLGVGYVGIHLWKLSIGNNTISPVSWGSLDALFGNMPSGSTFVGTTAQDNNTLILAVHVGNSNPTLIQLYYIDVSGF